MALMIKNYLFNSDNTGEEQEGRAFQRFYRRRRKRKKVPRKKLFKYPDSYSFRDYEHENHIYNKSPLDLIYNDFDDYDNSDYVVDFYEDKNYEYIDQDDSASIKDEIDLNNIKFQFENIDYDNYEYDEVGVLNFREPAQDDDQYTRESYHSYRRKRRPARGRIYSSRKYLPQSKLLKRRLKQDQVDKKRRSNTMAGLQTTFDISSLITIGGLWAIWQVFLVRLRFQNQRIGLDLY